MSNEDLKPSVPTMLRITGANTSQFMEQVAAHIEQLEMEVARLTERVSELEAAHDSQ